ncbi:MAG: hypothetical protein E6J28_00010 [Chloroflexi bacterium]|nr:MAG: hypothetical protein E6J28_00010 [Chloroflexota bacterium]
MAEKKIIGLLVGRENTFPGPFLDLVNERGAPDGISAELAVLGGTSELAEQHHAVLVDRISHEVPYYRAHLKSAVLMGTTVINDPFWWEADEKFFECTLARKLGVAVPKTVVLPNKQYIPDIDQQRSLRNLQFPLDWEAIVKYTGLPAVLKPNTGGGWKDVFIVNSIEELITAFDQTGLKTMILQEFINWDDYVRCICIGRQNVLPIRYNPRAPFHERYQISNPVEGRLREQAIKDARTLVEALGYDMDTVEFAVREDVLYAIDFLNPAPDFDNFSIKEDNQPPWRDEHRWWKHIQKPSSPSPMRA